MNAIVPLLNLPPSTLTRACSVRDHIAQVPVLIFDVDGTLAETESVHRCAFNAAFREAGIAWYWDQPDRARARRRLMALLVGIIAVGILSWLAYRYGWTRLHGR